MKVFMFLTVMVVALTLSVSAAQRPAAPDTTQKPAAPAVSTFDGEITKLTTAAKTFTVKGTAAPSQEKVFYWDDKTEVTGVKGIAGLKVGDTAKVTYREDQGKNWATKIEVHARKS